MDDKVLKATHEGKLPLGETVLKCAVLEDKTRIITQTDVFKALGRPRKGNKRVEIDGTKLPSFLDSNTLKPYLPEDIEEWTKPVEYINGNGRRVHGFRAEIIPIVCEIYLNADDDGALKANQEAVAKACGILVRSLAKVGIAALVDEATGYQQERQQDELQQLLSAFISAELLPWAKRFPDEFYKQLFRLKRWQYNPVSVKRPRIVGKLTNNIVYERISKDVLDELQKKNPPNKKGNRRFRHHQFLTEDIGHPALERHISGVIALMRASTSWQQFERSLQRAYPLPEEQLTLDVEADDE